MKKIGLFIFLSLFMSNIAVSQNADINILKRVNSWDSPFMKGFSNVVAISDAVFVVGVPVGLGIYGLVDRESGALNKAIVVGASVVGAAAISQIMKYAIDRQRPFEKYPGLIEARVHPSSSSFPSSHTSTAFALATSLSLEYPKWYIIAPSMVWASCVGLSRMNQGVHYPSDVLGGIVVGAGTAYLCYRVNKWWFKKQESKASPLVLQAYNLNF